MEDRKIRVAITHGDTNGIGYELIFKTFAEPEMLELCTPIIYGSPKIAAYHRKAMNIQANFSIINRAEDAQDGRVNLLTCFDDDVKVEIGTPTKESGEAALKALDRAMTDFRSQLYDVLVACPVDNTNMSADNYSYKNLKEYSETSIGDGAKGIKIMINETLRIALATDGLAIKDIPANLTEERLVAKIKALHASMQRDFRISNPRIAVLALNPHAGDCGVLGHEESDIILPVIKSLSDAGMPCYGPYAADGFFGAGLYRHFDGILAMYHDQGLAPFKALSMSGGVNFTANLPIVRTSPDHGTAYDIAGKGIAQADSFRQAIYTAIDVYRNRVSYDECHVNPLPKLYQDRKER